MKEMVIIIRPEKLEKVKQIMDHEKLGGISISSVMGCGTQRGVEETGVQSAVPANLLPKIRVQIVLEDEKVEDIIARIRDEVATGHVETERSSSGTWRTRCGSEPGSMGTELYNRSGKV